MRRILTVALALLTALTTAAAGWPTDHGDNLRSGASATAATFRSLHTAFVRTLDGAVYGSPILVGSSVVAATENNTVYALDPATGAVRWSHHLRAAITDTSVLPCGNISPTGITGSPAYDAVTGRLFVVTVTYSAAAGVQHEIWGLNPTTGATVLDRRIEVPGTSPKAQQQRGALAVDRGNVYVPFGGLAGDCDNYRGAVLGVKANGAPGLAAYVVPTPREGAIWAPGGAVVEPNGNLLVAVGNGESTSGYDRSDSITELNPALQAIAFFAPSSWANDNANDLDLGSMTPAYTGVGYVLQAGKSGVGYTVRTGRLAGIGSQVSSAPLCHAYGVSAVTTATVYLPCTEGVSRVEVHRDGTFTRLWTAAGIPGSPVVGPGALYSLGGGRQVLYALSGSTGRVLGQVTVGETSRFATPMLSGHLIYVPTTDGVVGVTVG